jgi:hypothetical protein
MLINKAQTLTFDVVGDRLSLVLDAGRSDRAEQGTEHVSKMTQVMEIDAVDRIDFILLIVVYETLFEFINHLISMIQ